MNDLISRRKLIEHLNACLAETDGKTPITDAVLVAIKCAVEEMPGVDAVPVVRCKDCVYADNEPTRDGLLWCNVMQSAMLECEYCSHGRRNDESR